MIIGYQVLEKLYVFSFNFKPEYKARFEDQPDFPVFTPVRLN